MTPAGRRRVRAAVEGWSRRVERPLPWRGERDPYRVLVSEVMLQQTQAGRVAVAYPAFLCAFPDVEALARAASADVIRAWGTLGYPRRALNLWRAARAVVGSGGFPVTAEGLGGLPGVGTYTARAVASFAFGAHEAPVDANVRRILTRVEGLAPDAGVQTLADELVPAGPSSAWNQALMDLGALVCRPRSPACPDCPLRRECAWAHGVRPQPVRPAPRPEPFASTLRYVRGRVMAVLRETPGPLTTRAMCRRCGLDPARVAVAIRELERDGLVTRRGSSYVLGADRDVPRGGRLTGPAPGDRPRRTRGSAVPSG